MACPNAYADVRKADVVLGATVEAQGLTLADCPSVEAEYAILMDQNGNVFFERNADAPTQIASITKIMTAVTALDSVPTDTIIEVSENAAYIGESTAYLQPGDSMKLSDALVAMLVPSGNDSAQAIAESVGAVMLQAEGADSSDLNACCDRFVAAMNAKSAELGLSDTVWAYPHGLDDGIFDREQHSTARDVAKISAYAMQKQAIRDIVSQSHATCEIIRYGETIVGEFDSTDQILESYEGACGIKTGYTDLAGACFAGACNRGIDLYAIALNSVDEWVRFEDVMAVWDWFYSHGVDVPLATSDTLVVDTSGNTVPLVARVPAAAWMDKTIDATIADPDATVRVFDIQGNVSQEAEYDNPGGYVHAGDIVGKITYRQRNKVVAVADLVAVQDVPSPNILEAITIWWNRLIGGFFDDARMAEPQLLNQMPTINDKSAQS
ncbi:MAG: D-alanyl-D-alanine carboxypeptidase [Eggerthellaceae bacterium]|nr:D-alanyl-D-alanine carboxypeptidase [Eggerthellaceae bacterium]